MRTSSFTFSSERVAAVTFALVLAALVIPYELLVRTSEARYGVRRTNVVMPLSASPKIDALVNDLNAGERYTVYALGTSRTEEGVRSDVIDRALGRTFNLGMSGSSALSGFEVLERLDERPKLIVVGVTPMDFTANAVRRGAAAIRLAQDSFAALHGHEIVERGPAAKARMATYSLLHGAAPHRRRNLGQWYERFQMRGDLLKFINNADAVGKQETVWIRGFAGVPKVSTPEHFRELQPTNTPDEYVADHAPLYDQLQAFVAKQRARGAEVVFVRLPLGPVPRDLEDAAGFDRDVRAAAERARVRYIDGQQLMGDAFVNDRRNFVDGGHLNVSGSIQFSRALGEALR